MSEENSLVTPNDEQGGVVDQPQSHSDFDLVEINTDGQPDTVDQETEDGDKANRQTREDNHAAKAARQRAERETKAQVERAKAEARAEYEKELKSLGIENPYTDKPMETLAEFKDYAKTRKQKEQEQRAEDEGKTLAEIQQEDSDKEYIRRKRQEDSERADMEKAENERRERVDQDLAEFTERYPEVDVSKVVTNESFKKFAGSRLGKESLADLYDDFVEIVGVAESNGQKKMGANRSTGSGDTGGDRMTAEQRKALREWNEAYPDMKMTAQEFLSR